MKELILELSNLKKNIESYDFEYSKFEDSWRVLCLAQNEYISKLKMIFDIVQSKEGRFEIQQLTEQVRKFLKTKKTLPHSWIIALINSTIEIIEDESV